MKPIRIATRKSRLAMWQSRHAAELLQAAHPGLEVELLPMSTRGDEVLDRSLAEIGGKGLFLKELEMALLDGRAEIAVHSLKDVPAESPQGLILAACLPRANWADLWLTRDGRLPGELAPGSRVGTSSLRRRSQLLRSFPALEVMPVRGNVETRLGLMTSGQVDAVILAAAGIERLDLEPPFRHPLMPPLFVPAPAQGVIVIQCRAEDSVVVELLQDLDCEQTRVQVSAERAVVATLGADCRMPLAALALQDPQDQDSLTLHARLTDADGRECIDVQRRGRVGQAQWLGQQVGQALLDQGGARLLSHF